MSGSREEAKNSSRASDDRYGRHHPAAVSGAFDPLHERRCRATMKEGRVVSTQEIMLEVLECGRPQVQP